MSAGRPLRFLSLALGGWAVMRVGTLWPALEPLPTLVDAVPRAAAALPPVSAARPNLSRIVPPSSVRAAIRPIAAPIPEAVETMSPSMPAVTVASMPAHQPARIPPTLVLPGVPASIAPGPTRFAGSAWLIARGGSRDTLLGGQLGGSQAGVRLTYALGSGRRVALAARLATPLGGTGREAALGLDWQPTHLPVHLIAEQRIALDGARGGPTVGIVAGYGPAEVRGFRLEAYGQAGVIRRDVMEGYGDGAVRMTRAVARIGGVRIDLGGGGWGGIQRGARRLDLGPTLGIAVPVATRTIRLALDWRERVAGNASPGSGPALSIGSDF